jgi:Domain of unknown function (DUF4288)
MWYAVNLLFEGVHPYQSEDENLCEESIRVIEADSEETAAHIASESAKRNEVSFKTLGADEVRWRFVRVERVFEVGDGPIASGMELFSRFLRASEVKSLLTPFNDAPPAR